MHEFLFFMIGFLLGGVIGVMIIMCGKGLSLVFFFPKKGVLFVVTHLYALRRAGYRPIHHQHFLFSVPSSDGSGGTFQGAIPL